jgi:hypothetical protein
MAGNLCGWIPSNENSRLYQISSEVITNLGARRAGRATYDCGEEMKATPTALGMILGEPDFAVSFGEENEFTLNRGGRFEAGGGREILARGAGSAQRAGVAEGIFRKANQCTQLH